MLTQKSVHLIKNNTRLAQVQFNREANKISKIAYKFINNRYHQKGASYPLGKY